MAFDNYEIRRSPATSDEVLAILLEHHRLCSLELKERNLTGELSRQSTIAEYENYCLDDFPLSITTLSRMFGLSLTAQQWKDHLSPRSKKTLGEFCDAIAPLCKLPRIEKVTVLGATSQSAGAFLVIRKLLIDAGVDRQCITPSSLLEPVLRDHPETFWMLPYLAPGRMPIPRVNSPSHRSLGWITLLGKCMFWVGGLIGNSYVRWIGFLNFIVGFIALCTIGRMVKPARVQLGCLQTFRDLSRALVGETWGMWRGFPMDV